MFAGRGAPARLMHTSEIQLKIFDPLLKPTWKSQARLQNPHKNVEFASKTKLPVGPTIATTTPGTPASQRSESRWVTWLTRPDAISI